MRLIYIGNIRIPTEKAHGIQSVEICEEFAKKGLDVIMLAPWRFNKIKKDVFEYYGVQPIFKIKTIPSLDIIPLSFLGKWGFLIQAFSFAFSAMIYSLFFTNKKDIFFSIDQIPLFLISFFRANIYYEMHHYPGKWKIYSLFFKKIKGIIATNKWKAIKMEEEFGFPQERILVYPNAVDIKKFDIDISTEEARKKLSLPIDKKIVLYTGHLFSWKGVDTLALASRNFGGDVLVYFVGGTDYDRENFKNFIHKEKLQNKIVLIPHQPHSLMPIWQKIADVLVLPNTAKEKISKYYMGGPMKLAEYMVSMKPIVASDLVSVRDVVDDSNVIFFEPDNPEALADAVKKVLYNPELARNIAEKSRKDVQYYSWDNRISSIINFINK